MTDSKVILTVIRLLGGCALLLILGIIGLNLLVIQQAADGNGIDPTASAVLQGVSGLAGTALGGLGSLLASTRSGPPEPAPTPQRRADDPLDPPL